jgi:hypothetical protein
MGTKLLTNSTNGSDLCNTFCTSKWGKKLKIKKVLQTSVFLTKVEFETKRNEKYMGDFEFVLTSFFLVHAMISFNKMLSHNYYCFGKNACPTMPIW